MAGFMDSILSTIDELEKNKPPAESTPPAEPPKDDGNPKEGDQEGNDQPEGWYGEEFTKEYGRIAATKQTKEDPS